MIVQRRGAVSIKTRLHMRASLLIEKDGFAEKARSLRPRVSSDYSDYGIQILPLT
jgi:hypothetical protein